MRKYISAVFIVFVLVLIMALQGVADSSDKTYSIPPDSLQVRKQDSSSCNDEKIWMQSGARVLPAGRYEVGIFAPLKYGFNNHLEFEVHPLLFFIDPNFSLKWQLSRTKSLTLSSRHSFNYPTHLLRLVAREGMGGLISPEFEIPQMFSLTNELIITRETWKNQYLSARAALNFALKFGNLDERTTIDLPFIYPRMSLYYNDFGFRFGSDLEGKIYGRWWYLLSAQMFYYPGYQQPTAFETDGFIYWRKSASVQFSLGYKLSRAEYPFGWQTHLILPVIDILFGWN